MKYKWKKLITLFLVICMLGISATGCGSAPAAGNEVNAPTKLDTPEPITDEADETETGDDADLSTQADDAETSDYDAKSDDMENASEPSGKWHVYDADLAAAVDADFEGSVCEINADSFSILPTETSLLEDGSLLMVERATDVEASEEELVKVVFDDNTVFTLRDIYDGGARSEDSDANFEDVQEEATVSLKGEFQNDIFYATAVRIIKVH